MNKQQLYNILFNHSLTRFFIFLSLIIIHTSNHKLISQESFTIVIDPGHGGKDPGRANESGVEEKDIVLNISIMLAEMLKNDGNEVILTRDKDIFISLRKRASIANEADADLFISIHCNAWHKESVYGSETFIYGLHVNDANFQVALKENEVIFLEENYEENYKGFDPSSPESLIGLTLMQEEYLDQSILLASYIQNNFTNVLKRKNRGVKQAGFWVLHNTYMPSVLIEAGFITNKKEEKYLTSKKGQKEIAKNIFSAILKYKQSIFNKDFEEIIDNEIYYSIQIAAGKKPVKTEPNNFNGLDNVFRIKEKKLYRYYYKKSSNINELNEELKYVKSKGFKNAFIVKFVDNKPVKN